MVEGDYMSYKALWKNTLRAIQYSLPKYISLLLLIFLGVGFYSGIKATGPSMLKTANEYYRTYQLADFQLLSSLGFDQEEVDHLQHDKGWKIQKGYTIIGDVNQHTITLAIQNLPTKEEMNQVEVVEGRLPQHPQEIVLEYADKITSQVSLNDWIQITQKDYLKEAPHLLYDSFQVVGFVKSPASILLSLKAVPQSNVIQGLAFVPLESVTGDYYTDLYVQSNELNDKHFFTDNYQKKSEDLRKKLEEQLSVRAIPRKEKWQKWALSQLIYVNDELNKQKIELADAKQKLDEGQQKIEDAKVTILQNQQEAEQTIDNKTKELLQVRQKLLVKKETLQNQLSQVTGTLDELYLLKEELIKQEQKMQESQQSLAKLKEEFYQLQVNPIGSPLIGSQFLSFDSIPSIFSEEEKQETIQKALQGSLEAWRNLFRAYQLRWMSKDEIEDLFVQMETHLLTTLQTLVIQKEAIPTKIQELQIQEEHLKNGQKEWEKNFDEVEIGFEKIQSAYQDSQRAILKAQEELNEKEKTLQEERETFKEKESEALEKITKAEKDLEKHRDEILKQNHAKFFVFDRGIYPGYLEFKNNADRLSAIAKVFPLFFFIVAALIFFTTMRRLVMEERTQIGILTGLGYSKKDIAFKYFFYAETATLIGAGLGVILGQELFPRILFTAYQQLYHFDYILIQYDWIHAVLLMGFVLFGSGVVVWGTLHVVFKESGASLLRGLPPIRGHQIVLENVQWIWQRCSFQQKIMLRNLFRYKGRNIVTVLGVMGCTALIVTGLGISNSISGLPERQYRELFKYHAIVSLMENTETKDETALLKELATQFPKITVHKSLTYSAEIEMKNIPNQSVQMVGMPFEELQKSVLLRERETKKFYSSMEDGVFISEKLGKLLGVKKGDKVTLSTVDGRTFSMQISGVLENYIQHWIYMSPNQMQEWIDEKDIQKSLFVEFAKEMTEEDKERFIDEVSQWTSIQQITLLQTYTDMFAKTLKSLNTVTIVLVISAALLAFVVIYNLSTTNISERMKELATLKVLGLCDKEISLYIFNELFIVTTIGIVLGWILGNILHRFVLKTAEMNALLFPITIYMKSYVIAALLTYVFSSVVMLFMHWKMTQIKMVEALKAEE